MSGSCPTGCIGFRADQGCKCYDRYPDVLSPGTYSTQAEAEQGGSPESWQDAPQNQEAGAADSSLLGRFMGLS